MYALIKLGKSTCSINKKVLVVAVANKTYIQCQNFFIFDLGRTWMSVAAFIGCYDTPRVILISLHSLLHRASIH